MKYSARRLVRHWTSRHFAYSAILPPNEHQQNFYAWSFCISLFRLVYHFSGANFYAAPKIICVVVQVFCEQDQLYQSCMLCFLARDRQRRKMEKIKRKGLSWTKSRRFGHNEEEEPSLLAPPSTREMHDTMSMLSQSLQIRSCGFSEQNMFERRSGMSSCWDERAAYYRYVVQKVIQDTAFLACVCRELRINGKWFRKVKSVSPDGTSILTLTKGDGRSGGYRIGSTRCRVVRRLWIILGVATYNLLLLVPTWRDFCTDSWSHFSRGTCMNECNWRFRVYRPMEWLLFQLILLK